MYLRIFSASLALLAIALALAGSLKAVPLAVLSKIIKPRI
jgi:hypothetical protein